MDGLYGTGNRQSLAIEICENVDGDLLKATNLAVELTAYLMKKHNIPLANVVQHNKWSGKNCPNRIRKGEPYDWNTFLNKVQAAYNGTSVENEKPLSNNPCKLHIGPASSGDINTICALVNGLGIKTEVANGYIITGETSKGDQITIVAKCKELGLGCKIYETPKVETPVPTKGLQATSLKSMTNEQIVAKVGPLFTEDQKKTGVLASVSMAQFLLESAYGKSELAQKANNCFGMKKSLSGNTWTGSAWDGTSVYAKETKEQHADGTYTTITAEFRKYACIEDSIADHSAYLVGAKNGTALRYAGLKGETDYKIAAQIIKDGGYATSLTYVEKLCSLIEQLGLTRYDVVTTNTNTSSKGLYRVRKSWDNVASQLGAYASLENAKAACKTGYSVFDENGKVVYPVVETSVSTFSVGQAVKLVAGAKYINGTSIPSWVLKTKLYVREVRDNGTIVFSTLKSGAITGVAAAKYFVVYGATDTFEPYTVTITADALNVRKGPGVLYGKVTTVKKCEVYTIIGEKNGFLQLKSGAGWISAKYVKKN